MSKHRKWFLLVSLTLMITVVAVFLILFQPSINNIHRLIESDYQSVSHISASDFSRLNSKQVIIFDVRQPEEFAVSHIDGAIQISPNISAEEFLEDYSEVLAGKQVVFYCSVGRRSSALVSKLGNRPNQLGAKSSLNLIGGLFSWVNDDRALSSETQIFTDKIHPYNNYWGRLIDDQAKISYKAE